MLCNRVIQICRVYSPPETKEDVWILVDRLWPRGLKKDKLAFDWWLQDIAPSTALRRWFHNDPLLRWDEFVRLYTAELNDNKVLIAQVLALFAKTSVTLFYAAKDNEHNHAIVLQHVLASWPHPPHR